MATDKELWKAAGKRLAAARSRAGYPSQKAFSVAVDLAEPTIAKYEQGVREIPMTLLHWLAEQHGIDVNWIVTGQGNMLGERHVPLSDSNLPPRTEMLIELMNPLGRLINEIYREMGVKVTDDQRMGLLARWYANLAARIGPQDDWDQMQMRLATIGEDIRAELKLKAENLSSSKRSAL
ncbi:helix-turn-helix transcriptional regulator [Rhizobium sp. P38BS-XIX]|uniref:helix-turn-helix domain-containing protein n=1 Tax=Rhizobium sp. P38BS-XIX TaxID=2726740 RepID=UPI00145661FE|nr:helix-turn-helix transcriptional regulator [Rhizobium sp. P38BS-XIX]NLS00216.1 helix-turn-helix transcriptional regulator [Rhizobium sp. P38BS-XIX]